MDVNFRSVNRNQNLILEGPARFYRIEISKGLSSTYELHIEASNPTYFELFGFANQGHGDVAQLVSNTNSLGLLTGTVRIGTNISIPQLNAGGNYNISENAVLHVDGGSVTKPSGTAIVVYGKVIVSNGTLNANINSGITTRINGTFESHGGTTNLRQFRTSVYGVQHQGGYIQSGGTVNLVSGGVEESYPRFSLTYTGNVFIMSGGVLHIQQPGTKGGVFINSNPENISVTGGTVIFEISNNRDFQFTSKAPFWNLELRKTASNTNSFIINEIDNVGGTSEYLGGQPLRVLRDLYIRGTESGHQGVNFYPVTSPTNVNDVYIGGSFYIESGSQYWTAADGNRSENYNGTANLPTIYNTTYFNHTTATPTIAYFNWGNVGNVFDYDSDGNNSPDENMAEFGNFVLNRATGNELRITSPGPGAGLRGNSSLTVDVNGDVTIESGTLCQGRLSFRVWGSITNKDRLGTYYSAGPYPLASGTPSTAQVRFREDPPIIINTTDNAVFGNIRFNVSPTSLITFNSDMYIERMEFMRGIIYIGQHHLKVDDMWNLNSDTDIATRFFIEGANTSSYLRVANSGRATGGGANQLIMIITDGKASAAGLSLKVGENSLPDSGPNVRNNRSVLTFPIGFSTDNFATGLTNTYFRPAQVKVKDFVDDGYLNIRPVSGVLQTTAGSGGEILQHYWRVSQSEFTTLPTFAYRFYYRNRSAAGVVDLPAGAVSEANYVPGKVMNEMPFQRSYESDAPTELDNGGIFSAPVDANTRVVIFNGNNMGTTDDNLFGFSANAPGISAENANYTAGLHPRFVGAPRVFYSRRTSDTMRWDLNTNWSLVGYNGAAAPVGQFPAAGDIAYIKGSAIAASAGRHWYYILDAHPNVNVAVINFESVADLTPTPWGARIAIYPTRSITAAEIKGPGTLMPFLTSANQGQIFADIGDFANNPSSVVNYVHNGPNGTTIAMPTNLTTFPRLDFEANNAANRSVRISHPITVNIGIAVGQNAICVVDNDVYVKGWLRNRDATAGTLQFGESGSWTLHLDSDIRMAAVGGAAFNIQVLNTTPSSRVHTLKVGTNIVQNTGALTLYNAGAAANNAILEFIGDSDAQYTRIAGTTPSLYRIVMNKGNTRTPRFTFSNSFTLNGPTSGAGIPKAVELQNGSLEIADAGININLTTGNDSFVIPASAGLVVGPGQVNVSGANSGILLDGLLRAQSTGIINMDDGVGVNNFIEYSASGNATIEVANNAQLIVGSQIRRSLLAADGVLRFTQTGGTVVVGKNAAPQANRGVFEVLNNGSRFIQTGGTLIIIRPQTAATEASLLLEPSLHSVGNATIQIGNDETPASSVITVKSNIELGNVIVTGANNPTLRLKDRSLKLKRDLTISAGSSFDGTGLFNLTVNRHIINNGTANLNIDTLFLKGVSTAPSSSTQDITGNLVVKHLVVEPETSVTLNGGASLEVNRDLFIRAGQLVDGGNSINVSGNVYNDAAHVSSNPAVGGIIFSGASTQRVYGLGQFGRIEINNPNNVIAENNITLQNNLTLRSGIFQIQYHKLTLGLSANIINEGGPFSDTKMVAVDGSSFLRGIEKFIPTVSGGAPVAPYDINDAAYSYKFTVPIGSDNGSVRKYTPVEIAVANNNSIGSTTTYPVNDKHITIDPVPGRVLQYYWNLSSYNLSAFTGLIRMHYLQADVRDNPSDEANYLAARLYSDEWSKFAEPEPGPGFFQIVDEANNYVGFTFNNASHVNGDYTAGIGPDIPDNVPVFISTGNGSWINPATWVREGGGLVPDNGPAGHIVRVLDGHTVSVEDNFRQAYRTEIHGTGKLFLGSTVNHILGIVSETGTIEVLTNSVPAGNYDAFVASGGGTFEFGGAGYGLPTRFTQYNNLIVKGSGTKSFPAEIVTINGNLSILGTTTLSTSRNVNLRGNITKDDTAELVSSNIIKFEGNTNQEIIGNFSGAFWIHLANSTGSNINLSGNLTTSGLIWLENGILRVEDGFVLQSDNNTGFFSSSDANFHRSWIEGTFRRRLSSGTTANYRNQAFTIGRNGKVRHVRLSNVSVANQYWTAEYFDSNPLDEGMDPESINGDPIPLEKVSNIEFWRIVGPDGASARVQLNWGFESGLPDGDLDLIRNSTVVGEWNGSAWTNKGNNGSVSVTGNGTWTSGTVNAGTISSFSTKYFTIATTDENNPLPVEFLSIDAYLQDENIVVEWITATERNNDYFTVERSRDAVNFEIIAVVKSKAEFGNSNQILSYSVVDLSPIAGLNYYRVKQTDFDGTSDYSKLVGVFYQNKSDVAINIYPNPNRGYEFNLVMEGLISFESVVITITNIHGKTVQTDFVNADDMGKLIRKVSPIRKLEPGVYIITVSAASGRFTTRMVVN